MADAIEQLRVNLLLDVTGQQKAPAGDRAEEHDRHIVDAGARVWWGPWHGAGDGPQHLELDVVHGQVIAGSQQPVRRWPPGQLRGPRRVPGSRPQHPGLERAADPVPLEQQRESCDMVLVRV